jgi:hypothetical protein
MKLKKCNRFMLLGLFVLSVVMPQTIVSAADPSEQEKTYISSAGGYLKTQNEQGMKVATTMNRLNTGASTLDDLRKVIKDARYVTNAGWHGDFLRGGNLVVPVSFQNIDKKIRQSHFLREGAYDEYLEYWKDGKTNHIESGNIFFKKSEVVAQEATKELTEIMQAMNKGK